jgi:hypothetical protein
MRIRAARLLLAFPPLQAAFGCLFLFAAGPASADVAVLGKGFRFNAAGSLTSAPAEVISGSHSIKGSYSGPDSFTPFLYTDPTFVQLSPNQTYTIALSYRILTAGSRGFEFGFFSQQASNGGHFLQTATITGAAGSSGTATVTATLESYADYAAGFKIGGTGAIAIDDIRITDRGGQLVAAENGEGPTIAPGPLNFQLTDATGIFTEGDSTVRSAAAHDLNGDGYPEAVFTFTAPRPSTTSLQPLVVEASGRMRLATGQFFPAGAPTVKHSPQTLFADINHDGLEDIVFAEAGSDAPPWQGSGIGVALNTGGGTYRNVSSLVPADVQTTRSYAMAIGDVDGDGRVEIILPDQNGPNPTLLRWNGNGFDAQRNWIPSSLWQFPDYLTQHSWLNLADFDRDGRQDLLLSGQQSQPSIRILFGAPGGFTEAGLVSLPDGLFGHAPFSPVSVAQGAEVDPVVVADFNNDGWPDIFATEEQDLAYPPGLFTDTNYPGYNDIRANGGIVVGESGFQVLLNQGARRFIDVTSASTAQNLGRHHYSDLMAVDMNNDGFVDIVGVYQTQYYAGARMQWGTTLFLNDGTGAFQLVDGTRLLASATITGSRDAQQSNLGSFIPTVVNPQRTEGVVFDQVGGCGGPGFCTTPSLNLYKVVANRAIGTGPEFADSATLGVPGFNEFFYLRHYPDAAAAVQRGEYRNGLAHFLAVGASRGYQPHAANGRFGSVGPSALTSAVAGSTVTLAWQPPASGVPLSYVIEAGSSTGAANLAVFDTGSTATTLAVPNVPPGTYFVRIRARTAGGTSSPSNEIVVSVGGI